MPLEYIYTFAERNHNSSGGSGFVVWPPKELRAEKAARQIVEATGVDDYQLGDHPFYAFTKYNHTYSLTRTFTTPHYSTKQPVRFSHIMILDPRERAYLSEGPICALRHFRFQMEYGQSGRWPCEQSVFQPLPKKEPQPLPQCKTWQALTGDAGWCGWCAEQVMEGKTLFWVYNPEKTNGSEVLLDLLDELIQLLPAERRWSVTFNTRVDIPSQIAQQILCFEERKESVISQIRLPRGRKSETIPLHRLSEIPCPDTDWVNYARTGQMTITNYETGVMVLNSDQYTYQELIEKFEKNYIQAEELDQAADELGTTENLIEDWEKRIYERKKELEERFNELGERQEFLGTAAAGMLRGLEERRQKVEERNSELERRDRELDKWEGEIRERQQFLGEYAGNLRSKLEEAGTELARRLNSMAELAEGIRAGFDAKIGGLQETIEQEAGLLCRKLIGKAEEYCDGIAKDEEGFLQQIEDQRKTFCGKIRSETEEYGRELCAKAISAGTILGKIRQDITKQYRQLQTARGNLEQRQKTMEELRKQFESEWKAFFQRAIACRSAINCQPEKQQPNTNPRKSQQTGNSGKIQQTGAIVPRQLQQPSANSQQPGQDVK